MAPSPVTSWPIDGETMETVTDYIFLGSRINADGDCSHEIKRHLLLGRIAMSNLDTGKMYGENNMETYITICKTDSQWEFAVCLRELKQGSVAT